MYFGCGAEITNTVGQSTPPINIKIYGSTDLLNWTFLGNGWNSTVNGITYNAFTNRPVILEDPADGTYYGLFSGEVNGGANNIVVMNCGTPWGSYSFVGILSGFGNSDNKLWLDYYDGSRYAVKDGGSIVSLAAGWLTEGTGSVASSNFVEGVCAFRWQRAIHIFGSIPAVYLPANDFSTVIGYVWSGQNYSIPWQNIWTTPIEQLPSPQGVLGLYGINGWNVGGIQPQYSYWSQSYYVLQIPATGQTILLSDRYSDSAGHASGLGNPPSNSLTWFPMGFDSVGTPQIPWVASFAPQLTNSYTLTGPVTGSPGTPLTLTLTPGAQVTNDYVYLSDGGAGGTFTYSSSVFTSQGSAQTVTYTPFASGPVIITATSGMGFSISGSPLTITIGSVRTGYRANATLSPFAVTTASLYPWQH
jgi:hypothetical protein